MPYVSTITPSLSWLIVLEQLWRIASVPYIYEPNLTPYSETLNCYHTQLREILVYPSRLLYWTICLVLRYATIVIWVIPINFAKWQTSKFAVIVHSNRCSRLLSYVCIVTLERTLSPGNSREIKAPLTVFLSQWTTTYYTKISVFLRFDYWLVVFIVYALIHNNPSIPLMNQERSMYRRYSPHNCAAGGALYARDSSLTAFRTMIVIFCYA